MRTLLVVALVVLSACSGSGQRGPSYVPDETNEQVRLAALPRDAAIPDAERKPFIEIVTIDATPDNNLQPPGPDHATADKPKGSVGDIIDVSKPEDSRQAPDSDSAPSDDVTIEDGVVVTTANVPCWSPRAGRLVGICSDTAARCSKASSACDRHDSYACFKRTLRTSGDEQVACLVDYGTCMRFHDAADLDPESTDVQPCVIFRKKPKDQPTPKHGHGFSCLGFDRDGIGGICKITPADCESERKKFRTIQADVGSCKKAAKAWCFQFTEGGPRELCWVDEKTCQLHHDDVAGRIDAAASDCAETR